MKLGRTLSLGLAAGLVMGVALFVAGAVAARLFYGSQMAPEGKFEPEELNAWYFIWTKLAIGAFFGVLLGILYESLPLSVRIGRARDGLKYAFFLWMVVSLWGLSHPIVYESRGSLSTDQLFWMVYTLGGFLGLGAAYGAFRERLLGNQAAESDAGQSR